MKCPICGKELPEPHVAIVRRGSIIWEDGEIGIPLKAEVSLCTDDCGFMYCNILKEID